MESSDSSYSSIEDLTNSSMTDYLEFIRESPATRAAKTETLYTLAAIISPVARNNAKREETFLDYSTWNLKTQPFGSPQPLKGVTLPFIPVSPVSLCNRSSQDSFSLDSYSDSYGASSDSDDTLDSDNSSARGHDDGARSATQATKTDLHSPMVIQRKGDFYYEIESSSVSSFQSDSEMSSWTDTFTTDQNEMVNAGQIYMAHSWEYSKHNTVVVELPNRLKMEMEEKNRRNGNDSTPGQRIPLHLQEIFLKSNRGEIVTRPPASGSAFKVFTWPAEQAPHLDSDAPTMPRRRGSAVGSSSFSPPGYCDSRRKSQQSSRLQGIEARISRWTCAAHDGVMKRPSRVPPELQRVFIKSNRGETVDIPPENGAGCMVFGQWTKLPFEPNASVDRVETCPTVPCHARRGEPLNIAM